MSSRSDRFECRWQASPRLLTAYLVAQLLAWIALWFLDVPVGAKVIGALLCLWHSVRYLRTSVLLKGDHAYTGLRRNADGWQLWSERFGWQAVQLQRDSIALPQIIVVRFRLVAGRWIDRWWVKSVCIPSDSLAPDTHRRLRLRLKFSQRRWAAPE
ncbi:MAG TPA: protein YgfX [Pseudomonas sp.]|uniref:protein YgfX n=1 Tax=Pseudomonas sp. TaxID=306 RepID=UPI002ED91A39